MACYLLLVSSLNCTNDLILFHWQIGIKAIKITNDQCTMYECVQRNHQIKTLKSNSMYMLVIYL